MADRHSSADSSSKLQHPPSKLPRKSALSLQTVLIVPFILQIFAAVGLTGWLSLRNGQKAVNEAIGQLGNSVTDRIDGHVENYLNTPHLFHQINDASIRNGGLDLDDFESLQTKFRSLIQIDEAVDYIYFGNEYGDFLGVQELPDGNTVLKVRDPQTEPERVIYNLDEFGTPIEQVKSKKYDPRTRPWYKAAKQRGEPTWSPIFPSAHLGVLQITPVIPISTPEGEFRGALGTNLILSQIGEFLAELDIGKSGVAFTIERSGDLVASSTDEEYLIETEAGEEERVSAVNARSPLVAATTAQLFDRTADLATVQTSQQFAYSQDGERYLVQVTPFEDGRGLDWLIVVTIPESDFMAQINANTRTTIALCAAALAVATGVGILAARWVTRPILQLNAAAASIARGEWEATVGSTHTQEVGELAKSFEQMAHRLQSSFTTLEEKNAQLQHLDKLKDEFLANTSHELRTPLNGTIGIVESMLDGATGPLSDLQRQNLQMVAGSGRRLSNLVNDILDFSKLKHKNIELQLKPIYLRDIIDIVLTLSQSLVGSKDLQLVNAISPELPPVEADENRLQQILYNLVGNAIKFTQKGFVGISAEQISFGGSNLLAVTISDTGIGIAQDKLDRVFASFEQADGSTAREYGGTGLGLTVSKQLVELHGGEISVRSIVDVGSQFTFTLPVSQQSYRVVTPRELPGVSRVLDSQQEGRRDDRIVLLDRNEISNSNHSLTHRSEIENNRSHRPRFKILTVDDEPINLQVLVNYLAPEYYDVTQASNGMEAIALIENGYKPDLVLLDVMMPKMTGYEVCGHLRQIYSTNELPILMLTAKNQVNDLVEALNMGANDYLTKPVNKQELLARIQTHLKLASIYTAYGRFVPHQFLEILQKESILEVRLGDEVQKNMSVLFSDIRDFTSLSEQMTPTDNFRFINSYLSTMEPAILDNHGFIDKYIGDAIMALFGESADDAVRAGIMMLRQLQDYNQNRRKSGYEPIRVGIGINTGDLMLGTVGCERRMDGTVISDAVNLASRLEGLTKQYGVPLLISQNTFLELQNVEDYQIRLVDRVNVKGKTKQVSVFEVFDADAPSLRKGKATTKTLFEQAIVFHHMQAFEEAAEQFKVCVQQVPEDTIARAYLALCQNQLELTARSAS
ncbi:response regulator [Oscillatoriales cyanobacterium LEGE 11467]|uniref:Circadian input-output histidine kinase CikA n=2 Tax=Zarconia TaxID=2992130 RepID=A0A928Z9C6_9CYAN|nr:response regulator [Zarconia navalis LEGE 11467]